MNDKLKIKVQKPWIGYPGSLIQQSHGETVEKGYLVWNIKAKDAWDVEWKKLINLSPFVTIPWLGTVKETIKNIEDNFGEFAFLPGTRYRVSSSVNIPQIQSTNLTKTLKENYKAAEVVFKTDVATKTDTIKTNGIKISKKGLSNDPDTIVKLYKDFIETNKNSFDIPEDYFPTIHEVIKNYLNKLHAKNTEFELARNVVWSIKEFKFDNLFCYGENNYINFSNLENIIGIFANNRSGKSSIIGSIIYTLFNTTDRGSLKNSHVINRNKNYCYGQIRISNGNNDYVIERKTTRSKKNFDDAVSTVNLWKIKIDENGDEIKICENGESGPQTDAIIRKIIGTAEDFMLTALASQGNLNRFIENKATKRKEILNRFLELDIFDYLYEYAKNDYQLYDNQNQKTSYKELIRIIEKSEKEIFSIENDIKTIENKILILNQKRDELNVWIKSHENNAAATNDTNSFENLKNHIIKSESELQELASSLKTNKEKLRMFETSAKLFDKKVHKTNIQKLFEEQKIVKDLEQSVSELNNSFKINNQKLNHDKKIVHKLTVVPCGDQFPQCHYIKDAHETKTTISEQTKLVEKISKDLENSNKLLIKYVSKNIDKLINEYNDLKLKKIVNQSNIQVLCEKIKHDEEKIILLKKDLKNSKSKLRTLNSSANKLDTEDFKKKKLAIKRLEDDLKACYATKNEYYSSLGAKKQCLDRANKEQNERKDLILKLKIFDSIQAAFSKNGIPAMILKSQLPSINRELTKILDNLMDFSVTLETDTNSNIMDVYLNDGKSKRLVEMCSGMEKTICSLALRVALSNLSSLPKTDILILDESFGALDEENMQKSIEFLTLLRGYFKYILLISHEAPIKEIADRVIEINTSGSESSIEVK